MCCLHYYSQSFLSCTHFDIKYVSADEDPIMKKKCLLKLNWIVSNAASFFLGLISGIACEDCTILPFVFVFVILVVIKIWLLDRTKKYIKSEEKQTADDNPKE